MGDFDRRYTDDRHRWLGDTWTVAIRLVVRWQGVHRLSDRDGRWQAGTLSPLHPLESTEMLNGTPCVEQHRTAHWIPWRQWLSQERNAQCNWRFFFLTKNPYICSDLRDTWSSCGLGLSCWGYTCCVPDLGPTCQGDKQVSSETQEMLSDAPEPAATHSFSGSNSLIWKNKTLGVTEKRHFQHFTYNFNS